METIELKEEEKKQVEGGSLLNDLARTVDNIIDVCDDLALNGSKRPFKKYE